MDVSANCGHAMNFPRQADTSNTLGQRFDKCGPSYFYDQLYGHIQDWHPGIVALSLRSVKEGRWGYAVFGEGSAEL